MSVARVDTPVLVVGGGPAGMTTALLLARRGIPCRVVERRATPQPAPAAHVVNARTFEILRSAGVDMQAVAAACQDPADTSLVFWMTTLAGRELGRLPYERQDDATLAFTPTPLRNLSQHLFEPILADAVRATPGIDLAYGHEWQSAAQDGDGVISRVRDHATDTDYEVRSRWLVAADGASSPVRRWLGIAPVGPDRLQSFVMIHLDADFRALVGDRRGVLYWTTAPDATGTFVAHDLARTWVYMHPFDPEQERVEDYGAERCAAIVRRALGSAAHPFTVRTVRAWTMTAQVAERYRDRRVFLVGDSAHRFPPTGGLGLNTGVQDAHNLVWKLAAVETGAADDALLDTYEEERRPVAQRNADVSLQNAMRLMEVYQALAAVDSEERAAGTYAITDALTTAIANQAEHFDMLGLQIGFAYGAGAIAETATVATSSPVRTYLPSALPGARLPHAWVVRDGRRVSSLDLVPYDRCTLITGPDGEAWRAAAAVRSDVHVVTIGHDVTDSDGTWTKLLALDPPDAILVRPDQHVAWRSTPAGGSPAERADAGQPARASAAAAALARALAATLRHRTALAA